jgi:hypothetical protein
MPGVPTRGKPTQEVAVNFIQKSTHSHTKIRYASFHNRCFSSHSGNGIMHLSKDRKWSWIGKGLKKKTVREVDWKVCIQNLGSIQIKLQRERLQNLWGNLKTCISRSGRVVSLVVLNARTLIRGIVVILKR